MIKQMHYQWGQTAVKKDRDHFEQRILSKKQQYNFDGGWLEQQQGGLHSFF